MKDMCADYQYDRNVMTKLEFITTYLTNLLGNQSEIGSKEFVCKCWNVGGNISDIIYVIIDDNHNPVMFDYFSDENGSNSNTILECNNINDLHKLNELICNLN